MTTLEQITKTHANHISTISPGLPAAFSAAATPGDCIAQGDLYVTIVDRVPDGYVHAEQPARQLVPESGAGSHHRLDSLEGVEIHIPVGWRVDAPWGSLDGPCLILTEEREVRHEPGHGHPHGTVTIPAGQTVLCTYQREWLAEQRRVARVMD